MGYERTRGRAGTFNRRRAIRRQKRTPIVRRLTIQWHEVEVVDNSLYVTKHQVITRIDRGSLKVLKGLCEVEVKPEKVTPKGGIVDGITVSNLSRVRNMAAQQGEDVAPRPWRK